jgi:CelD/BcsL family acetyltransferase involved in cellulose biosynthesis
MQLKMKIIAINDEQGFDQLSDIWNQLLVAYEQATIHSTFQWLRIWWDHYRGNRDLLILVARDGEQTLGIAPFAVSTSTAVKGLADQRTIQWLGQGSSDYGDFIVPERHDQVMAAVVDHLLEIRSSWDRIDLRETREDSPNLAAFLAAAAAAGLICDTRESTICLQAGTDISWDDYYGRVRAKFRSDVRRRLAKLEQIGPVELVRHDTADEALWEDLLAVNEKHFDEKNKQDLTRNLEFLKDIADGLGARRWLDISLLKVGGDTAAYNIGFRFGGVVYHWKVGFDPDYYKYSPGRLLIRFLLEQCCGDGTTRFDFMRGAEEYKRDWAFDERKNINVTAENKQLGSKVKSLLRRTISSSRD